MEVLLFSVIKWNTFPILLNSLKRFPLKLTKLIRWKILNMLRQFSTNYNLWLLRFTIIFGTYNEKSFNLFLIHKSSLISIDMLYQRLNIASKKIVNQYIHTQWQMTPYMDLLATQSTIPPTTRQHSRH